MADVRLTLQEAKDLDVLPHVCIKCGAPAVIARPAAFGKNAPGGGCIGGCGGGDLVWFTLVVAALNLILQWKRSKTVTLLTPLCQICDEGFLPGALACLEAVEGETFVLSGVAEGFASALEAKRSRKLKQ